MNTYTYRELQQLLKAAKNQGLTSIKLNAKFEVLEAEFNRIYSSAPVEEIQPETVQEVINQPETGVEPEIELVEEIQPETEVENETVQEVELVDEICQKITVATNQAIFQAKLAQYRASKPPINPITLRVLATAHSFKKAAQKAKELVFRHQPEIFDYTAHRQWMKRAWAA